jgi:hypothetical protein
VRGKDGTACATVTLVAQTLALGMLAAEMLAGVTRLLAPRIGRGEELSLKHLPMVRTHWTVVL